MQDAASVAPAVRDGWIVWEVPGKPISVRLSRDVVDRLGLAVQEGFKALPRRGLETGGLLIGTKREAGDKMVVDVNDFEPVESEHAAGPSYLLSDADRRLLGARIAAREGVLKKSSIVGFYRSHTRRDFAITMEDASLFSTYFRKGSDVFLLVKANEGSPPTGGFLIREGGKILSDRPYVHFPLDRTAVIPAARETPVLALQKAPTPVQAVQAVQAVQPLGPRRTTWIVRWPIWLAIAGAMALAVGVPFGIQRSMSGSIPAKPGRPLALKVTNTEDNLRLSWDHQSPLHAGQAFLWIKDGPEEQKFELDSKQFNEGSVAYWPRTSDVTFRLELLSDSAHVTESVRAIGGPIKALVAAAAPAAVDVEASAAAASSAVVPPSAAVASSVAAAVPTAAAVPPAAVPTAAAVPTPATVPDPNPARRSHTGTASRQLSRAFAYPQPVAAPAAPALLPDPPTIQPMVALPLDHSKEVLARIAPANSPGPHDGADSSFRVSVEPVSGSRAGRNIPLIGKRLARADYVPPVPIRNPAVADPPHRTVAQEVNIDVKVYINPSGKVDYSEVLSKVAKTNRDLAALAMFAARRWEFVPARAGQDTVPGEAILHYQFGPGSRAGGNQNFVAR